MNSQYKPVYIGVTGRIATIIYKILGNIRICDGDIHLLYAKKIQNIRNIQNDYTNSARIMDRSAYGENKICIRSGKMEFMHTVCSVRV